MLNSVEIFEMVARGELSSEDAANILIFQDQLNQSYLEKLINFILKIFGI